MLDTVTSSSHRSGRSHHSTRLRYNLRRLRHFHAFYEMDAKIRSIPLPAMKLGQLPKITGEETMEMRQVTGQEREEGKLGG